MILNTLPNNTARRRDVYFKHADLPDPTQAKTPPEEAKQPDPEKALATLAHDLRTVINLLTGASDALSQTVLTSDQRELVETMQFGADNMLGLVNNFLDFSKLQVSDIDFNCQPFDLCEFVFSLQRALQIQAKNRPVRVFSEIGPHAIGLFPILDELRLRKILFNLLDNALKFTRQGRVTLHVHLAKPDMLEFQVSDTGPGIAPADLEHIFKPFWREKGQKVGGTGLGLSIVRELVERQGGDIRVESKLGEGTVFTVTIPFERTQLAQNSAGLSKLTDDFTQLQKVSILAVDDNPLSLRLLGRLLEAWKCEFQFAATAAEAIEHSQKKRFDLILLDINLPDQDGLTLARNLRMSNDSMNRQTPLIGLSGASLPKNDLRIFDAFLEKPYTPHVLQRLLLRVTQQKKSPKSTNPIGLNFDYLLSFCEGDRAFASEIIELFLQNAPEAIQQLKTAVHESNFPFIYQLSHRLKSNFFTLGIHSLENLSITIERLCLSPAPQHDQILQLTEQLATQAAAILPVIRKSLSDLA